MPESLNKHFTVRLCVGITGSVAILSCSNEQILHDIRIEGEWLWMRTVWGEVFGAGDTPAGVYEFSGRIAADDYENLTINAD